MQTASAAENMAIDEAIFLENQQRPTIPTLRLYGWQTPTISLGMFQNIEMEINLKACRSHCIDVVRRITGGKAVFHAAELTYCVVGREEDPNFPPGILGRYRAISEAVSAALSRFGVQAEMKKDKRQDGRDDLKGFCFSVPSQYELLVGNKKICGSAQARSKGSFLQHGSLLIDFNPDLVHELLSGHRDTKGVESLRQSVTCLSSETTTTVPLDNLCGELTHAFESRFDIRLVPGSLTPDENVAKNRLLEEKYRTDCWNHRAQCPAETILSY